LRILVVWHIIHGMQTRQIIRTLSGIGRGLLSMIAVAVALLVLVSAMIIVQGQRDEARPVGAAVVLGDPAGSGDSAIARVARFEHAGDLYRRGMVSRIILTGKSAAPAGREYLTGLGLPPQALLIETESATMAEGVRAAGAIARAQGVSAVIIVADPPQMLTALKVARDEGLAAYGSPTHSAPGEAHPAAEVAVVLRETWRYLTYVLAGQ